jgi:hypothetical protein
MWGLVLDGLLVDLCGNDHCAVGHADDMAILNNGKLSSAVT